MTGTRLLDIKNKIISWKLKYKLDCKEVAGGRGIQKKKLKIQVILDINDEMME